MIKYVLVALFSVSVLNAQSNNTDAIQNEVEVGDVFEIGRLETNRFKHIEFSRANFIIKRGGIANYKSVAGSKVVVTSIKEKKDGTKQVAIQREDGGRFFGSHTTVAANFEDAVGSGELKVK
ncbi:hypothetical protein [Pricia sp.]|uniref:hypothetical protein n=1 Tax=Pricia sp. TaxID=2268138 RepID=UPI003593D175